MVYYILFGTLGLLLILIIGLMLFIYFISFYSPYKGQSDDYKLDGKQFTNFKDEIRSLTDNMRSKTSEEITCLSYDFKKLKGHLYRATNTDKVAICFHGYRGTPKRDFAGGAGTLIDLNVNVILPEQRAHCSSEGHSITFGRKEQKDVNSWITLAKQMFGDNVKIYLFGISMGAATVLFASQNIDKNIKIFADCPYSTQKEILKYTITNMKLNASFMYPFVYLSALLLCHCRLKDDASKTVANSNCKILIVHGTSDSVVPYQFSERIYLENKDKVRYEKFENAEHGLSYLVDENRYKALIKEWISD